MMELLALTGALQLLAHLQLRGTVYSDCQGLIRKLQQRDVLRRNTNSPGFPLLRDCQRLLSSTRSTQWIKGHPERSQTPKSGWSQDQWGNYIADHYARPPHTPPALHLPTLILLPPADHQDFASAALRRTDWHFVTNTQSPLLASLPSAINHGTLCDYLTFRDDSRAERGAPPRWTDTTALFAAKAWQLSKRGIAQRGSKVRHLWDLRWHGENQAIAAAGLADHLAACPLCGHPSCSQSHILCDCPGLSHERAGLLLDFLILTGQLARGPCRALGRAVTELLFHHPGLQERGQLWTGLWTPQQRGLLAPYLHRCTLRDGQRTLLTLGQRATEGVRQLWTRFTTLVEEVTDAPPAPLAFPPSPSSPAPPARSPTRRRPSPDPGPRPITVGRRAPHTRPPPEPPDSLDLRILFFLKKSNLRVTARQTMQTRQSGKKHRMR